MRVGDSAEAVESDGGGLTTPPASPFLVAVTMRWDCNKARLLTHLGAVGYTADMLCVEAGDEASLVALALTELGMSVEDDQLDYLVGAVTEHIANLLVGRPLRKRSRSMGFFWELRPDMISLVIVW